MKKTVIKTLVFFVSLSFSSITFGQKKLNRSSVEKPDVEKPERLIIIDNFSKSNKDTITYFLNSKTKRASYLSKQGSKVEYQKNPTNTVNKNSNIQITFKKNDSLSRPTNKNYNIDIFDDKIIYSLKKPHIQKNYKLVEEIRVYEIKK